MRKFLTFLKHEEKLMLRAGDSVFFGVLMPVGIALLIGFICGDKPTYEGSPFTYSQNAFSSLMAVGICATAFMSIPLIMSNYREAKILKHFFVTPTSPAMLLGVELVVCFSLALISAIAVGLVSCLVFGFELLGSWPAFIGSFVLVTFSMYGLGMVIAGLCRTVRSVNVATTAVYFPMLFLSGATIPYTIFPEPLRMVADVLPLTHGIKLMQAASLGIPLENAAVSLIVVIAVGVVGAIVSIKTFRWQ